MLDGGNQLSHVALHAVLPAHEVPKLAHGVADPHRHAQRLAFLDRQTDVLAYAGNRKTKVKTTRKNLLHELVLRRATAAAAGVDGGHHDLGIQADLDTGDKRL